MYYSIFYNSRVYFNLYYLGKSVRVYLKLKLYKFTIYMIYVSQYKYCKYVNCVKYDIIIKTKYT